MGVEPMGYRGKALLKRMLVASALLGLAALSLALAAWSAQAEFESWCRLSCDCFLGVCGCEYVCTPRWPDPPLLAIATATLRAAGIAFAVILAALAIAYLKYGCFRCIDARHITQACAEEHG